MVRAPPPTAVVRVRFPVRVTIRLIGRFPANPAAKWVPGPVGPQKVKAAGLDAGHIIFLYAEAEES